MDKIFFRCAVLTFVMCITLSWYSPAYSRARSGEEGSRGGMDACGIALNKLDGSNESIISPPSKSKVTPLLEKKLVKKEDLEDEDSTVCTDPYLPEVSERSELKDNNIAYLKQIGMASWYGNEFDGKITASGELCNIRDMVGSHRTLPFGTLVDVTNNLTGQSVTVRVNDRGPFVSGRIINLSRSAAEKIDLIEKGVVEVSIRVVNGHN